MPAMTAVGLVARTLHRRLGASILSIALVAGVAGGLATGLVAGAARTRSAPDRALEAAHVLDLLVSAPTLTPEQVDEIRALPAVKGVGWLIGLGLVPHGRDYFFMMGSVDGRWGQDVDVARIVRGRAADPDSADEVVLGETAARALGVDVGDVLRFDSWSPEQLASWAGREPTAEEQAIFLGPSVDVRVVGIGRHPADLTSDDPLNFFNALPPGFLRTYGDRVGRWLSMLAIDVGDAPSPAHVAAAAEEVLRISGEDANLEDAGEQQGAPLVSTIGFVATAMLTLAAAVGVAGMVLSGAVVARTLSGAAEDTLSLAPLGMTRRDRALALAGALLPAALAAGALALAVAVAASAFLPFGLARRADPGAGLRLDPLVVAAGAVVTAVLVLVIIGACASRAARRATARDHAPRLGVASWLARTRLPVGVLSGIDLASVRGRGRAANRAATVGVGLATVAGVGALVLVANVDHVFATPAAYGWIWDFETSQETATALVDDPAVESVGVVTSSVVSFDGQAVVTRGISSLKGRPPVLVTRGGPPGPDEVVFGARTMASLGVRVGDTITARGSRGERELNVAGEAVFAGVIDAPEAGWGAAMQLSGLEALGLGGDTTIRGLVGLVDGADRDAFASRIASASGELPKAAEPPMELQRLREIESFPWLLTGFLVVAGFVVVGHAVIAAIRRRSGDLAVLRSMGLGRRGVYQAISTHAVVVAVAGTLVGVPLGVVAGQALWRGLARSLGLVVSVRVPWPAIATATATACFALAVLALLPARRAARARPAALLRAE
jgi:hypothetical protein